MNMEFEYAQCIHCGDEIVRDQRTRTGWRHVLGGVACPEMFAVPKVIR